MSTSGEIVRSSVEINSASPPGEKHPVKLVAIMTSARHAARTRVIDSDWCWLYISSAEQGSFKTGRPYAGISDTAPLRDAESEVSACRAPLRASNRR